MTDLVQAVAILLVGLSGLSNTLALHHARHRIDLLEAQARRQQGDGR
jgi:hypothetical protein